MVSSMQLRYYAAMRRMGWALAGLAAFFCQNGLVQAQDTVDALEKDLQQIKQERQEATTQTLTNFFNQLTAASQSPDAALALYINSGGPVPPPSQIQTSYAHETPHEKEAREAQDAARLINLAYVAQLHCGLMRFAGTFVMTPDQKGLHQEFAAWLKSTPQIFAQIKDDGLPQVRELRRKAMAASPISSALGFTAWGDKEQGTWNVSGIPGLYRAEVLEPLRVTPNTDTLAAWDVYISLKAATQPDQTKWAQVEYPALMFERGCDDYAISPTMDKLQALVAIIKASPTHPKVDDMIAKVHTLAQDYRTRHPGATTPQTTVAANAPPPDPNVKVTTVTEGDMTIITTQTNATAATPPPAPPPAPPAAPVAN